MIDLISFFPNYDQGTFKSHSGTHGSLLDHVEQELTKNSNSYMVSRLTNVATPLLFMIFDLLLYLELDFFIQILLYVVQHASISA